MLCPLRFGPWDKFKKKKKWFDNNVGAKKRIADQKNNKES